jgi:phage shock protein A
LNTLWDDLEKARSLLAVALEDENVTGDEIRQRVEAAIEAHNQLERRRQQRDDHCRSILPRLVSAGGQNRFFRTFGDD